MDKVQFQLEATLPELKDLYEKGLFTKREIDEITRRRTALESSLVRRNSRKEDYFKYAEYDINLEKLRKLRWKKLRYDRNPPPPSASTYSIPRRVMYILKRATVKFPSDLAVWLAYVEYASHQRMRKVVVRGLTTALQHHPLSPTLYLLLSFHHLHPNAPFPREAIPSSSTLNLPDDSDSPTSFSLEGTGPARTTLLLGLRALPHSTHLWTEYIKLELGWVEALRRRWDALGLKQAAPDPEVEPVLNLDVGEGSFGPEGEDARKAILSGQLVKQAIRSSLEAVRAEPDAMAYRKSLIRDLRTYPSPLRVTALDAIYRELEGETEPGGISGAQARLLVMTRRLYEKPYEVAEKFEGEFAIEGEQLVEETGRLGKEIRKNAKTSGPDWLGVSGSWIVDTISSNAVGEELKAYLFSVLTSLTTRKLNPPVSLLHRYLSIAKSRLSVEEYLDVVRVRASAHPQDPSIQRTRLETELQAEPDNQDLESTCEAIAKGVVREALTDTEEEDVEAIWSIWSDVIAKQSQGLESWRRIIRSAQQSSSIPALYANVLPRCFRACSPDLQTALPTFDRMRTAYGPPASFYRDIFPIIVNLSASYQDLAKVYETWRATCKVSEDKMQAALVWAEWLVSHGKAHEARLEVEKAKKAVGEDTAADVESRWQLLLQGSESPVNGIRGIVQDASVDEEMGSGSERE